MSARNAWKMRFEKELEKKGWLELKYRETEHVVTRGWLYDEKKRRKKGNLDSCMYTIS